MDPQNTWLDSDITETLGKKIQDLGTTSKRLKQELQDSLFRELTIKKILKIQAVLLHFSRCGDSKDYFYTLCAWNMYCKTWHYPFSSILNSITLRLPKTLSLHECVTQTLLVVFFSFFVFKSPGSENRRRLFCFVFRCFTLYETVFPLTSLKSISWDAVLQRY